MRQVKQKGYRNLRLEFACPVCSMVNVVFIEMTKSLSKSWLCGNCGTRTTTSTQNLEHYYGEVVEKSTEEEKNV